MENRPNVISRRTFLLSTMACAFSASLPLPKAVALPAFDPFSFVFVTDTHLTNGRPDTGAKMLQESQLFLQESIKVINHLKPDFVVFGGDQVEGVGKDDANWLLFGDLAQAIEAPWTFVLGEHDVIGPSPFDKMKAYGPDWKARGIDSANPYWSLNPMPNVHLVGLDTSVPGAERGNVSRAQLDWLKEDLARNKGKFTIVVCHHPVLPPPPYDGALVEEFAVANGAEVREILGSSPDVRMVISGHVYVNKVQTERDIYHISCAAMDIFPCQFKQFRVSREGIVMESFTVPFPALVKKAFKELSASQPAIRYNSKNPAAFARLCQGGAGDQNALLSLSGKIVQPLSKKDLDKQRKGKAKGKDKDKGKDQDKRKGESEASERDTVKTEEKLGNKVKRRFRRKSRNGTNDQPKISPEDISGKTSSGKSNTNPD